jgi:antitoxin component HigA of HigAB toxin-antitoxin module
MAKKKIRPIRTETEYDETLEEIERYFRIGESRRRPVVTRVRREKIVAANGEKPRDVRFATYRNAPVQGREKIARRSV